MVQNHFLICENCGEPYTSNTYGSNLKVMNYIKNPNHQCNPYSNIYHPSWINYPNFS